MFRVIDLDVWGNGEDGYDINDMFRTSYMFDLSDTDDNAWETNTGVRRAILAGLKECGFFKPAVSIEQIEVEEIAFEPAQYEVRDASNGKPICFVQFEGSEK